MSGQLPAPRCHISQPFRHSEISHFRMAKKNPNTTTNTNTINSRRRSNQPVNQPINQLKSSSISL